MTIWLIGGTQESAELAKALADLDLPCLITVVTEPARLLYPTEPTLRIQVGCLSPAQIEPFLYQHQISCILDASHPFAVEISQLAITAAVQHQIPYLRYERPLVKQQGEATIEYFDCFETLLNSDRLTDQQVLLTVGYRSLPLFQSWQSRATLFARILPSAIALQTALTAGFTPDRLIALRPPISAALETALWQQWQITAVVTKASGTAGGEQIKQQVAAALGVSLIVIDRPAIAYPRQTADLLSALAFCQAAKSHR